MRTRLDRKSLVSGRRRGFALVSAIFLLVVLAGLGAAMLTFSTAQQAESGLDVMGSRAYQAARAGIEWALFQRLNPLVAKPDGSTQSYCTSGATYSFQLPGGTSLSPFTVTVSCVLTAGPATPNPITIRTVTATACNQPVAGACPNSNPTIVGYVQRQMQVTLSKVE